MLACAAQSVDSTINAGKPQALPFHLTKAAQSAAAAAAAVIAAADVAVHLTHDGPRVFPS